MTDSIRLARLAVGALRAAGVTDVVLCPGSRSAPLAYALTEPARPGPRVHVRHDERVAAFTALGVQYQAWPGMGAVVTTSGTAAANLHPAVLEAHHADRPLVVVTADRPPVMRGTWANQTSELQAGLFGGAVRARLDLDDAAAAADPRAAADAILAAVAAAWGPNPGDRPGPVHLNLGFTDPLVPGPDDEAEDPSPVLGRIPAIRHPPREELTLPPGPRTLVIAGDDGRCAAGLAEQAGWPLLAEPSSGARQGRQAIGPYRLLLELPELAGDVERVVVFGRPTLSRPVTRLLSRPDVEVVLCSRHDPGRPVTRAGAVRVPAREVDSSAGGAWSRRWLDAGRAAQDALDAVLDDAAALSGPLVARELMAAVADGRYVVAAASNPIRDLDLAMQPREHVNVVANRGLAGIDGTLSTAMGLALATEAPVRALVGDLAFLHDSNALIPEPGAPRPNLQVVLLNDGGGGIFSLLEHGARAREGAAQAAVFERAFGTPHGVDIEALCRAYGVVHVPIDDVVALRAALAAPLRGISLVEVRLGAGYRAGLRDLHARIRTAVHACARGALQR